MLAIYHATEPPSEIQNSRFSVFPDLVSSSPALFDSILIFSAGFPIPVVNRRSTGLCAPDLGDRCGSAMFHRDTMFCLNVSVRSLSQRLKLYGPEPSGFDA
jgi:hypothetical protein